MVSALNLGSSGVGLSSWSMCCVVRQNTLFLQYSSLCKSVKEYWRTVEATRQNPKRLLAMGYSRAMAQKAQLLRPVHWTRTYFNCWKDYESQSTIFCCCFQFLKDGYAAHLTALSSETISRPAVGNSRLILRRGCFGLPSRASKTRHKIKRSISDRPSPDSDKECSSTLSGTFNYSSFRYTKGRSVSKFDEQ